MKKIKYIIALFALLVFSIPVISYIKPADSGFDSGYGGGYSGGGYSSSDWGSSSSSYDYSYSSGSGSYGGTYVGSSTETDTFLIIYIMVIIFVVILSMVDVKIGGSKNNHSSEKLNTINDVYYKNTLYKIKEVYPNISEESIINEVLRVYKEFVKCMNERDLDSLKLITNETFYLRMVETLDKYKENNFYSIEEDIKLRKGFISFLDFFNNEITCSVVLNIDELQYFVDKDKKYLRGNKEEPELIPYQITIKKTLGANNTVITNKVLCTNSEYIVKENDQINFSSSLNIDKLLKIDPELTENNIINEIYKKYEELQYAWSEFDYDKMRTLLSDELYNNYRVQLKTLSTKGQKNVMKDIEFVRGSIKYFEITESSINITVELAVTQNDYIVDEDDNIIKGDKIKDRNTYELLVTRAISPNVRNNCCPNCGAAIGDSASQTCEYCGASLITLSKDFVIAKKRILVQR